MNDTEIYESFGKKLKERRKELGLTQKDLAKKEYNNLITFIKAI